MTSVWDEWKSELEQSGYDARKKGMPTNEVLKRFSVNGLEVSLVIGKKPAGGFYGKLMLGQREKSGRKKYPINCVDENIFSTKEEAVDYIESELRLIGSKLLQELSRTMAENAKTA